MTDIKTPEHASSIVQIFRNSRLLLYELYVESELSGTQSTLPRLNQRFHNIKNRRRTVSNDDTATGIVL